LGKGVALESGEMSGRRLLAVVGFVVERGCWVARLGVFGPLLIRLLSISCWGVGSGQLGLAL